MNIKECRLIKGYSQEKMARLLDISTRSYQNIENGKNIPNVITGLKISQIFNVDPFILYNVKLDK